MTVWIGGHLTLQTTLDDVQGLISVHATSYPQVVQRPWIGGSPLPFGLAIVTFEIVAAYRAVSSELTPEGSRFNRWASH